MTDPGDSITASLGNAAMPGQLPAGASSVDVHPTRLEAARLMLGAEVRLGRVELKPSMSVPVDRMDVRDATGSVVATFHF